MLKIFEAVSFSTMHNLSAIHALSYSLTIQLLMNGFIYLAECGFAPNVTLNCNDRSAHVKWVASQPDCQYFCKAYWTCVNGTYTHKDEVTR